MALIKTRPRVQLLLPRVLEAGTEVEAIVRLNARRAVPIEFVDVLLVGTEAWWVSSGNNNRTGHSRDALRLGARLRGEGRLPAGRTELPVRFALPAGLPPSYSGRAATVAYEISVHVSIPRWPDRRASFAAFVAPPSRPNPETQPAIYSSNTGGATGTEPHAELSLTSTWSRAGDVISGAFALSNVGHNRYSEVRVGLVAQESVYRDTGQLYGTYEPTHYQVRIGVEGAREGEMIPFSFRVPADATPTLGSAARIFGLSWLLELQVGIRWGRDLTLRVPFDLLPAGTGADGPARLAPPAVGSERLVAVWRDVAREHGLTASASSLHARIGETHLEIQREHRGRSGAFLVCRLDYPDLHLDLEVELASGVRRALGGGVALGLPAFDRAYHVLARDEGQVGVLLGRLAEDVPSAKIDRMSDTQLRVSVRDAGQSRERLSTFASASLHLARRFEDARSSLPPPPRMADALPEWQALARRLGGRLETARMRLRGQLLEHDVDVRTTFDAGGQPMGTCLAVETRAPLDDSHHVRWKQGDDASFDGYRGEVRELFRQLSRAASAIVVEAGRIEIDIDHPLGLGPTGPDQARDRLEQMARLARLLRGERGPYR